MMITTTSSDKAINILSIGFDASFTIEHGKGGELSKGVALSELDLTKASDAEKEALRQMALSAAVQYVERTFRS